MKKITRDMCFAIKTYFVLYYKTCYLPKSADSVTVTAHTDEDNLCKSFDRRKSLENAS